MISVQGPELSHSLLLKELLIFFIQKSNYCTSFVELTFMHLDV